MKPIRFAFLCVLTNALIWGCGQSGTDEEISVAGNVLGSDGKTPALAHVYLASIDGSYDTPIASKRVADAGHFELQGVKPGAYRLFVTATDHQVAAIPLFLESGDSKVEMAIQLALHEFKHDFDEVKIIGSWNDFSWSAADAMQKQDDGTFVFEVATEADTVLYQLLAIDRSGRSLNGTMSDFFEFDGGGDYRSGLLAKDGKVRIVFDPEALPRPQSENITRVTYDSRHQHLADLFEMMQRFTEAMREFRKAYGEYEREHGSAEGFSYAFQDIRAYLSEHMEAASHPAVREYAAMQYAGLYYYDYHIDKGTYEQIVKAVPISSPLWTVGIDPALSGLALLDMDRAKSLATQLYQQNPEASVQARALRLLTFFAQFEGDESSYRAHFAELAQKYGEERAVKFHLMVLDPDSRVAPGKPVPEFNLRMLDDSKTISNHDLRGQYYLIDFWATWCGPCIGEMPYLHEVYENFKDQNFTILSLSLDTREDPVREFRSSRWQMPWLHAVVPDNWKSELVADFNVNNTGIPSAFLISPEGKILASHGLLRRGYLQRTLAKYLGTN